MKRLLPVLGIFLLFFSYTKPLFAQSNQTANSGNTTTAVNFPAGGCVYSWTNDNPSIGLAASGTGNIPAFKAVNSGSSHVTATITATPLPSAYAYIANSGSNNVSVVSTLLQAVVATIPVGTTPYGVSVSPDGSVVYITNKGDNTVSVINTLTNTVTATITVGKTPVGIVVSPDGKRVYIANYGDNSISVIDASTNTVSATIKVGQSPYGIAATPDGSKIYVSNFNANSVSVINSLSNIVTATFDVESGPTGIAVSPDGSMVYVSNSMTNSVSMINALDNSLLKRVQVVSDPIGLVVSHDGSKIYLTDDGYFTTLFPLDINNDLANVASGSGPGISLTSDGSLVYNTDDRGYLEYHALTNTGKSGYLTVGKNPVSFGNFIGPDQDCKNGPVTFSITVNPVPPTIRTTTPTGIITTCAGTPSVSPNIQQFIVSGAGLTGDITATAPAGFEVSLSSSNGFANSIIISQAAGSVSNTVVYVRAAATVTAGNISGNVVLASAGATSQNVAVTGIVNALPTVNPVDNQTVTNGSATTAVNFTGRGNAVYNWTNDTPGIGLAGSGTGNIPSFAAVNTGNTSVIAKFTVKSISKQVGYEYMTNETTNQVSVISNLTNNIVSTIDVDAGPYGIALSPDGSSAYVSNYVASSVSVINTFSNKVVATITVGFNPIGIVTSPDGNRVYVCSNLGIDVIDATKNQVLTEITLSNYVQSGLTVSPDGKWLYVADPNNNSLVIINTITYQQTKVNFPTNILDSAFNVAVSPDGSLIYVTGGNTNNVYVVSANSQAVVKTINLTAAAIGIAISPDGSRIYVTNEFSNLVSVVNTITGTLITTITVGTSPEGISVSPDGSTVYVANVGSNDMSVINTSVNQVTATIAAGATPHSLGNFVESSISCTGIPQTFTITVNPSPPVITATGTVSTLTTVYGTPSASASFTVSGVNLPAGILVTPPAAFEVSTDNINFSSTVTVGTVGNTAPTPVYFRLAATTGAGTYPGNFVFTSGNVSPVNIEVPDGTVKPAPLTITANNAGKYPGTTLANTSGSIYYTVTGLQNGDQIGTANITYGPGAAADAPAGTYPGSVIVSEATGGTFNPANYTITYAPGDITVYETPVTSLSVIGNLSPLNTVYGTPSSSLSFTVTATNLTAGVSITPPSGLELSTDNNTFSSTITIGTMGTLPATLVYIRLAASAVVGTYSGNIILSSPGVTDGILNMPVSTVTPALLTVSADNKTKVYGTPNPPLTVTYTGFVNNDGPNQLTYQPLITTTAVTTSPYGEYPINASGAASPNYTFTYVPGYLTVAPSSQALVIPNAFTPNGDGINDRWDIKYLDYYPECTVNIFTRYGENVYQSVSYPVPWDGRYKGSALPTGVYYYIINLKNGTGLLSGNVTIIR